MQIVLDQRSEAYLVKIVCSGLDLLEKIRVWSARAWRLRSIGRGAAANLQRLSARFSAKTEQSSLLRERY